MKAIIILFFYRESRINCLMPDNYLRVLYDKMQFFLFFWTMSPIMQTFTLNTDDTVLRHPDLKCR